MSGRVEMLVRELMEDFTARYCHPVIPAHRVVGKLEAGMAIGSAVAAERERCAKIADSFAADILSAPKNTIDLINRQAELTYTMGYGISAERIAAKIRSGE